MKEKILNEINQPNVAIHCPTQAEADKLFELLGDSILSYKWKEYKEETCYYYYDGEYSDRYYALKEKFKILTADYVISALQPIKVGDIYKNSAGKLCTTKEIDGVNIKFTHENGDTYKAVLSQIECWTKQTSLPKEPPMIANLQPGTKVRVRPDLRAGSNYYVMADLSVANKATPIMEAKAGSIVTIRSKDIRYNIMEDRYDWTDEMFSEIISLPDEEQSKPQPDTRRNLAFYKRSGEYWAIDEIANIHSYCGDRQASSSSILCTDKYIFDNSDLKDFMYDWVQQETHPNFSNCKQVAYEDIFEPPKPEPARRSVKPKCPQERLITIGSHWEDTRTEGRIIKVSNTLPDGTVKYKSNKDELHTDSFLLIFKPRPDLDCLPEPTIKPTQKDNFMTKLKNTALVTVDQNKEALIIASKMEAGRIINKQVLKQLTPHLPFFLQGYTKSPLAPIVAANLVAMAANHTQNAKLSKVSELMLLGAADSGVASFNLDKIVDDILAGIKLPKGVLDTDEE